MKDERVNLKTDCIFERDSFVKDFSATVISCTETEEGDYKIGLDLTAFFPEGGGQSWDEGTINGLKVKGVFRENGEVVHVVDEPLEVGSEVVGSIDWEVRLRRMQLHSGEHLFCGIAHNKYGFDNTGFHLADNLVTLDIDGVLSAEQIYEIEKEANRIIAENVPITVSFPTAEERDSIEYRSKLELEDVRLVTIEGYDVCACCAPHVATTGQIGMVKIIDFMPHRGGMRMLLKAGLDAAEDYRMLDESNKGIMALLSSERTLCVSTLERYMESVRKLREENTNLKRTVTALTLKSLLAEAEEAKENGRERVVFFTEGMDDIQIRDMINETVEKYNGVVAVFNSCDGGYKYICGLKAEKGDNTLRELAKTMNTELSGRGGGSEKMIQGSVCATEAQVKDFFK